MIKLLSLIVEEIGTELFLLFGIGIPSKTSLALASALSGMFEVRRVSLREQPPACKRAFLHGLNMSSHDGDVLLTDCNQAYGSV